MAPLTLMAVHAHPDDEALSTGGILAKYSSEGVRTVLVTCTNGEQGDGAGGAKPDEPGHVESDVVALRRQELEKSAKVLGVGHLELLGYRDSGMMGWPANDAPGSFWSMPVEQAAQPLIELIMRYRPDVAVTYDENGFYGHPDHIQAHRITRFALASTSSKARLFYPTVRRSRLAGFRQRMLEAGLEPPDVEESEFGSPDDQIAASVDCREYSGVKIDALRAHSSQSDNIFFLRLDPADFAEMFGTEDFVLPAGRPHRAEVMSDLFEGLRQARG